jgi:hypothetical protein
MRERQRVEILRNLLTAQGFLSIADLMAIIGVSAGSAHRGAPPHALAMLREAGVRTLVVDHETRVTEAA